MGQLTEKYLPMIRKTAGKFFKKHAKNKGVEFDDILHEAVAIALAHEKKFDSERGVNFLSLIHI